MLFITSMSPVKPEHAHNWPEFSSAFTEAARAQPGWSEPDEMRVEQP